MKRPAFVLAWGLLAFLLLVKAVPTTTNGQFLAGSGTLSDPYLIGNIEELNQVRLFRDAHFLQISDIDASQSEVWNEVRGMQPIGNAREPFTGTYNGNGHRISNLVMEWEQRFYTGLFGYLDDGAEVRNIVLENARVRGWEHTGLLVGRNGGLVEHCRVQGEVTSVGNLTGGIAGSQFGSAVIRDSRAQVRVVAGELSGGLVGMNHAVIERSSSHGEVYGTYKSIGGLSGNNTNLITDSHSTAFVLSYGSNDMIIGGLIGANSGSVLRSYATGDVSGSMAVGGLVGSNSGAIVDSYATGEVLGDNRYIGGLVGTFATGRIERSRAEGRVRGGFRVFDRDEILGNDSEGEDDGSDSPPGPGQPTSVANDTDGESVKYIGGLVGRAMRGNIVSSRAHGHVSGGEVAGGLVGTIWETHIGFSFSTGDVSVVREKAGGLVGYNDSGTIENVYATGAVRGAARIGGLAGTNGENGQIVRAFASGVVDGGELTGGFVGENLGLAEDAYWDVSRSGKDSGAGFGEQQGITGLSTEKMTGAAAFTYLQGFDFPAVWLATESYPALYWQQVDALDVSAETEAFATLPETVVLAQNHPNPFNPSTRIEFYLPESTHVTLAVYDLTGQLVGRLREGPAVAGRHSVRFDAAHLSSGVYLYRLQAGDRVYTRKMTLVK